MLQEKGRYAMKKDAPDVFDRRKVQILRLWAKTPKTESDSKRKNGRYHPLLYHMLDVAAVAELVWDHWLSPNLRKRLEGILGENARCYIVFLSGGHDIGKASPGFQKRVPELSEYSGLPYSENDYDGKPHGFIGAHVLKETLSSSPDSNVLAQIAGGHHGVFPRSGDLQFASDTLGNREWKQARELLLNEFAQIVGCDPGREIQMEGEIQDPALVPVLAGFISVVDWIGSNQEFFPCAADTAAKPEDAARYWDTARSRAKEALEALGWLPAVTFSEETKFDTVFPGFIANNLQKVAIKIAQSQNTPYLMIIEAPMGCGKTEAALYAADLAMCRGFARGMYDAMPTQATGNAMFKRVLDDYLKKRGHSGKLNVQLVHGDALLAQMKTVLEGEIPAFNPQGITGDDNENADVDAQSWFTAKKRPLLAPFGVGTIDQSLLSVLQTKHWFVRLFGLSGKVVIFDEVHAYDAYMSTILDRLLNWLAEVDCTVILLSATLPESKRKSLVKAYSVHEDAPYAAYPRITLASPRRYPEPQANRNPECKEVAKDPDKSIALYFAKNDLEVLAGITAQKLKNGGCAAVICNTVNRSIEVYKHLKARLEDIECSLFHARTLKMWRREREEEVLRKFGKGERQADGTCLNADRPERAVLVATQVIEQSLDLDFDIMISEIAPIDLLLQRIGRLHRHTRRRPEGLETPQCIVLCDADVTGPPPESFGKSIEFVYDRYVLLRTWLALRQRSQIVLPKEIESLVNGVYCESSSAGYEEWGNALSVAKEQMEHARSESEKEAGKILVCGPKAPDDLIEDFNTKLADDENPEVHKTVRAATREGDPSITVVLLPLEKRISSAPNFSEVRELLDRSVKLSHRGLFRILLGMGSPTVWGKSAHLRHVRLLQFDGHNQTQVGDYVLTVDKMLGVVIEKKGSENNERFQPD